MAKNHQRVGGCFFRQVLGVCSIRIFAKKIANPYYEPTIVVHDKKTVIGKQLAITWPWYI